MRHFNNNSGNSWLVQSTAVAASALITAGALGQPQFCNPTPIFTTNNVPTVPYPSTINVAGVNGPIAKVTVTLIGFNYGFEDDVDVLLVGPAGQNIWLMSDAGANFGAANLTFTFDDAAATQIPGTTALSSGTFRPGNFPEFLGSGDIMPPPAPPPSGSTSLSDFNGTNANGQWQLFVNDDFPGADPGAFAGGWCLSITPVVQDRASGSEKGSVLIFSDVEVKWAAGGAVTQDTFIQLTNDNTSGVEVQMYFINGDSPLDQQPPLPAVATERAHPGWNSVDNLIFLTADQPTYWSVLRGTPATGGLSPWTVLDPGPINAPGRPDLDPGAAPGSRYLRGFIIAFAVNNNNDPISWNHLAGNATKVNYPLGTAFEYNAWAFQCVDLVLNTGDVIGAPGAGILRFDGLSYAPGFDLLLFNFQAVGATAFNGPRSVASDTDLTLHLLSTDLRENTIGPRTTKAQFDIWNQNEVKFSNAERCITCWHQGLLGTWAPFANHFIRANLQTNVGKARVDGAFSPVVCPNTPNNGAHSLLGIIASRLIFDGGLTTAEAGTNVFGLGSEQGEIRYDVLASPPPPANAPESNKTPANGVGAKRITSNEIKSSTKQQRR